MYDESMSSGLRAAEFFESSEHLDWFVFVVNMRSSQKYTGISAQARKRYDCKPTTFLSCRAQTSAAFVKDGSFL